MLISRSTTVTDFANFMSQLLPNRSYGSIVRFLYRKYESDVGIIADMEDILRPVTLLFCKSA